MTVFGIKSKGMDKSGQAQNPVKNGSEGATERFDRCALAECVILMVSEDSSVQKI